MFVQPTESTLYEPKATSCKELVAFGLMNVSFLQRRQRLQMVPSPLKKPHFYQLQKTVCEFHGIELIDMTHSSIINRENIKTMLPDYVHPTVECHAVMARELTRKINFF